MFLFYFSEKTQSGWKRALAPVMLVPAYRSPLANNTLVPFVDSLIIYLAERIVFIPEGQAMTMYKDKMGGGELVTSRYLTRAEKDQVFLDLLAAVPYTSTVEYSR